MQSLIPQAAILLAYLIVFVYQLKSIKHLKERLYVLDKFQAIFDIKKVEEYVTMIENKTKAEIETHHRAQLNKHLKDAVEREARAQGEEILNRYTELINVFAEVMLGGSNQDNTYLSDILPLNREFLERVLKEKRKSRE